MPLFFEAPCTTTNSFFPYCWGKQNKNALTYLIVKCLLSLYKFQVNNFIKYQIIPQKQQFEPDNIHINIFTLRSPFLKLWSSKKKRRTISRHPGKNLGGRFCVHVGTFNMILLYYIFPNRHTTGSGVEIASLLHKQFSLLVQGSGGPFSFF